MKKILFLLFATVSLSAVPLPSAVQKSIRGCMKAPGLVKPQVRWDCGKAHG